VEDNPALHEFALLIGGIIRSIVSLLIYTGSILLGWKYIWIVFVFTAANLFFR
jgi:hypothetical protein